MAEPQLQFLKDADFRREIKSAPATGYLLFGEEDYLKSLAVTYARETLVGEPAFAPFNEIVLDALDYHPEKLRNALMPLPMMAERKVILLRGLDLSSMKQAEIDALCEVLSELPDYEYNTVLLPVAAGLLDEGYLPKSPSSTLSKLCAVLRPVRYERCTPQKLNGWCIRHFEHNGAVASPAVCEGLIDRCGRNMMTLASEIDKISFYALSHGRTEITASDVVNVACATTEYDAFAFSGALMDRDAPRALSILEDMKFRRVDPILMLGDTVKTVTEMYRVHVMAKEGKTSVEISRLTKMHEYRVGLYRKSAATAGDARLRRLLSLCDDADRALKRGYSSRGYAPLEELICAM